VLQPLVVRRTCEKLREAERGLIAVIPADQGDLCAETIIGLEVREHGVRGAFLPIAMPLTRWDHRNRVLTIQHLDAHRSNTEATQACFPPFVASLLGPSRESFSGYAQPPTFVS